MRQFNTLTEAVKLASTGAGRWRDAYGDHKIYDQATLAGIAEVNDEENPADEETLYVVSRGGTIGICSDGEEIDWIFLTDSLKDADLPLTIAVAPQAECCPRCGAAVVSGDRFCGKCGERL